VSTPDAEGEGGSDGEPIFHVVPSLCEKDISVLRVGDVSGEFGLKLKNV